VPGCHNQVVPLFILVKCLRHGQNWHVLKVVPHTAQIARDDNKFVLTVDSFCRYRCRQFGRLLYEVSLVVGGQRENTKVRPELWTAMGILAMAMVFFGVAGWTTMAWAVAAVILLLTALVLIQKFEGDSHNGPVQLSNHQLGKGPHTRIYCPPCSDFVSKLENISNQLRDATKDKEWKIDWETFNTSVTSARSATNSGSMLTKGGLTARFKGVTGIEIAISSGPIVR